MNESELLELLGDARVATLATIRNDGRVDLVPITFAFNDQVVVQQSTTRRSQQLS